MTDYLLILLFIYIAVREYLYYRQTSRLQELLKASSLTEYKEFSERSSARHVYGTEHGEKNQVMEEPNEISIDDPEFDISKVTNVSVDGEEKPVTIV